MRNDIIEDSKTEVETEVAKIEEKTQEPIMKDQIEDLNREIQIEDPQMEHKIQGDDKIEVGIIEDEIEPPKPDIPEESKEKVDPSEESSSIVESEGAIRQEDQPM